MIDAGQVLCPVDLFQAALIYQHGHAPSYYLLAHILVVAAAFQGHDAAVKLSASTMDRYLRRVGQPQVFGTQLRTIPRDPDFSPEPFDRKLLPDFVRTLYNVLNLADLEVPLERMNQAGQPECVAAQHCWKWS